MTAVIRRVIAPPEAPRIIEYDQAPQPPQSVAEWTEQRIANLGGTGTWGAGAVVVQLLQAVDDKALRAAVAAGGELDEWARWGVTETLVKYREMAVSEFGGAVAHMDRIRSAWTRKWGSERPRNLPQIREFPAEGTGASEPFGGWPEASRALRSGVARRDERGNWKQAGQ
jgi:hypothetical protein